MSRRRVSGAAVAVLLLGLASSLAGCSQISALAPVGGDALAEVRFGAIDVLLQKGVDLLSAPVCTAAETGSAITCAGATTDGRDIAVISSTAADAELIVAVAGETIFSGSLADVLDEAARG